MNRPTIQGSAETRLGSGTD